MQHDRFVNKTLSELQEANRSPIYGYQHLTVLTLEEATEKIIPLVPGVVDYVSKAKQQCNRSSTLLTWDESAAIYLYSMPIPFFSRLNEALRAEDRHALKPWFAFLKLFITALRKLPSVEKTVWRGVSGDVGTVFNDGDVHIWWSLNSCSSDISVVKQFLHNNSTLFAIDASHGKNISKYSTFQTENEIILMPGTRLYAKAQSLNFEGRFFLVHLEEENSQSESQIEQNYLSKLLKQEYQPNNRIERIVNPSKTFPIEKRFINLDIIETKEQQGKEEKLLGASKDNNEILDTFEEIHATKTKIEIKNIFEKCNDPTKNILVLGRAGIGKTTFCRYVAYQWARGAIWQQYQLVILIHLSHLTESRYPPLPPGAKYSLIDLVKTEYLHGLSEEYERFFKEQLKKSHVLWLLDGYDEIVQNIPSYLKYLLQQLLKTPHHILTTRPYLNTLSYRMQLEITGFTNDNIEEYVKQFFDQIKDEIHHASLETPKLLSFLKLNPRIWGIVHIPVNLELMCSLWCNTDFSETTTLTMTTVYDKIIEWLCRRHLEKQNISSSKMTKQDVYTHLHKELAFLESLAFEGMESKSTILPPNLLQKALEQSACSLQHQPQLLNIGILQSLDYKPIAICIEPDKNHYFLHLSFQEHFAARYFVRLLNSTPDQKEKAINFIKTQKYNQRFEQFFTFASGLLLDSNEEQCMGIFWNTLLEEPLDLIGLRHVQIVISCLEEAACSTVIPHYRESIGLIIKWITYFVSAKHTYSPRFLSVAFKRSPSLVNRPEILATFVKLYNDNDSNIRHRASSLISELPISNPYLDLIKLYLPSLTDVNCNIRHDAFQALEKMGGKAATNEVINRLLLLLDDRDYSMRNNACEALGKMGEKAATNEVINRLLLLLADTDNWVRKSAYEALEKIGEKAPTNEVIQRLLLLLGDTHYSVRRDACQALGKMGEKAVTNEVINRLLLLFDDTDYSVRNNACEALGKIGEKAATNEVINRLLLLLDDTDNWVRNRACKALVKMGEKAATNEVINRLLLLLSDTNHSVRMSAYEALGNMGEKAATNEVINILLLLLGDSYYSARRNAFEALEKMGEKAATNEVIEKLLLLLGDTDDWVRKSAYEALEKMGEKAPTNEVIERLVVLLGDTRYSVRNSACKALGKMGVEAPTNEVIERLLLLLGDTDYSVRRDACEALGKMGEKAATNEVINRLLLLLSDTNHSVRINACKALGKMGEKAATNEVINRLLLLLADTDSWVRKSAYEALEKIGEKAPTNEVIERLVVLLGDTDYSVRIDACQALVKMGEKAATNEVINRLLLLLDHRDYSVRNNACKALGKMGEKAATNEVINGLLLVLDDTNDCVRKSACEALGKMGEKAATNKVLSRLLLILGDTNDFVHKSACEAFEKMGEKAATNELIKRLVVLLADTDDCVRCKACQALRVMGKETGVDKVRAVLLDAHWSDGLGVRCFAGEMSGKMFDSFPCMPRLEEDIDKGEFKSHRLQCWFDENRVLEEFVRLFLYTKLSFWLPIITRLSIQEGYGITVSENTAVVYGSKEPVELPFSDGELGQRLQDYLLNWLDKSLESRVKPREDSFSLLQ